MYSRKYAEMLAKFGAELARELGGTYRDPYAGQDNTEGRYGQVDLADSKAIRFNFDDYDTCEKLVLRGVYEPSTPRGYGNPPLAEISCKFSRGPAAIAKDVVRRLLPVYEPRHKRHVARVKELNEDKRKLREACERLSAYADKVKHDEAYLWFRFGEVGGDARLNTDGSEVSIELRYLPLDLAEEVLKLVKERLSPPPKVEDSESYFESMTRRGLQVAWSDDDGKVRAGTVEGSIDPENKQGRRLIVKVNDSHGIAWYVHWTALNLVK